MLKKKSLAFFLALPLSVSAYRPYTTVVNGAKTQATGTILSVSLLSAESVFNNPAFLSSLSNRILIFDFETELGFRGFSTDYRWSFNLPSIGGIWTKRPSSGKPRQSFGFGFFSLFRSTTLENVNRFTIPELNVKKIGFAHSVAAGRRGSFGYNVGLALAFDTTSGFSSGRFSMFPSFQLGYVHTLSKHGLFGVYFHAPLYLDWRAFSGYEVVETTPFLLGFGFQIKATPVFSILTELTYQGWDFIEYRLKGQDQFIDRGEHGFDFAQNVFVNVAFYIHGKSRKIRSLEQLEAKEKSEEIKEAIRDINRQLAEISRNDILDNMIDKSYQQRLRIQKLKESIKVSREGVLSPEDQAAIDQMQRDIGEKKKTIAKKKKEKEEVNFLFGAKKAKKRIQATIDKLETEVNTLTETIRKKQLSHLSDSQQRELEAWEKERQEIRRSNRELNGKIASVRKDIRGYWQEIIRKGDKGLPLTREEENVYRDQQKVDRLKAERKVYTKKLRKLRRGRPLYIRGEFYIAYHPEVIYRRNGSFLRTGNLSVGFSFVSRQIPNFYFTLSFTDKTILKLTQIHPDNDPVELFRVTTTYYFN